MITAQSLIQKYQLQAHPEGGWYKENYKSHEEITVAALPDRFDGNRSFSTAIYFLLEQENFSAFHRIKSDECWHFYYGGPLLVYVILPTGEMEIIKLGSDIDNGQTFQHVVPANCWFASKPAPESNFGFVGCTVAPGFDFADFEMAAANDLLLQYPQHAANIKELCR